MPHLRDGSCEPELVEAAPGRSPELINMSRRFWISLALSIPVLALEMGGHITNLHMVLGQRWSNWLQFSAWSRSCGRISAR